MPLQLADVRGAHHHLPMHQVSIWALPVSDPTLGLGFHHQHFMIFKNNHPFLVPEKIHGETLKRPRTFSIPTLSLGSVCAV